MVEHAPDDLEFGFDEEFPAPTSQARTSQAWASQADEVIIPPEFEEAVYLRAFPDIAVSIQLQEYASARDHYVKHGAREGRLADARYQKARAGTKPAPPPLPQSSFPPSGLDVIFTSPSGACLLIGWIDDREAPFRGLALKTNGRTLAQTTNFARCRRLDAEASLVLPPGHLLGFWTLLQLPKNVALPPACTIELQAGQPQAGAATHSVTLTPKPMTDSQLRETLFEYFASAAYFCNPQLESFVQLEQGLGAELLSFNRNISKAITAHPYVERYGPARKKFKGSIIVCLFGKHEFFFLQNALFGAGPAGGQQDTPAGGPQNTAYEYIYVSNSPELTEILQKEARIAERIYGLSVTLVFLPDNAGFGAANNVAAQSARSHRLMIVNPDVFPRAPNWAEAHSRLIKDLPKEQTALFGVPLFYDDGSLMHGGMYFDIDTGLSVRPDGISHQNLIRVEHYGKGAPATTPAYLRARPVSAVTGAFMSTDRAWFEKLGGFSEEYVFGHYEDADLCLKSLSAGQPVWLHNIGFWHLEGKGSTRRQAHEGGSLVNRWHFTKTWGDLIADTLRGRDPVALRRTAETQPTPGANALALL